MHKIIIFSLLLLSSIVFSQDRVSQAKTEIQNYLDEKQKRISDFLSHSETFDKTKAYQIWDIINGKPVLLESYNLTAGISTRTNHLQPNGSLNLDLTGENMVMGIWEVGGVPEFTHIEFIDALGSSRIQVIDNIGSSTHATHVAGTLIARGANPNARGMATKASLLAYDAIDDVQEVLAAATDDDLLISNHSYGVPVDNLVGANAEWFMGAYVNEARFWDLVAFSSPYYLPIKSAGNDGFSEYEGGIAPGFDKLTGDKVTKNSLIVANANQVGVNATTGQFFFANINFSSSQGPTDDGRIKPDITGFGTNVTSTLPGDSYGEATGTSMSSPNVAGSALLLQELYFENNNNYMLSSTLKGLISVTADDAGEEGPDQYSGWGLMNSKRAAEAISNEGINDIIIQDTLSSGGTRTLRINYDSDEDLKLGLAWTDPAGSQATPGVFNDPTPRLKNDLDLRLINTNDNSVQFPWMLNLNNLTDAAIKGDNIVDNIEIIEFDQSGVYDVVISHKGDLLTGAQAYSLIILNAEEVPLSNEEFNILSFKLWPNPTNNILNISTSNVSSNNIDINIVDMLGRIVYSNNVNVSSNISVDVSSLSKGLYLIEINDGQNSFKDKFVKK